MFAFRPQSLLGSGISCVQSNENLTILAIGLIPDEPEALRMC